VWISNTGYLFSTTNWERYSSGVCPVCLLSTRYWIVDAILNIGRVLSLASKTFTKLTTRTDVLVVGTSAACYAQVLRSCQGNDGYPRSSYSNFRYHHLCDFYPPIPLTAIRACQVSGLSIVLYTIAWILLIETLFISKTDTLLNKMIKYAVNRAVATSFCAVAGVMLVIPDIVIMELIINKVWSSFTSALGHTTCKLPNIPFS